MRKLLLLFVIALLGLVPAVSAQVGDGELPDFMAEAHTDCEVDLTGESYMLWHLGDLSGPYGAITQPVLAGLSDAADYFNERGGICGAEITLPDPTTIDTGGDLNLASQVYDSGLADDPIVLVLYGSPESELLRDRLAEDEIPVLISAGSIPGLYGESGQEPGWVFATNPLYVDQFGHFCEYAAENLEETVIGYISWEGSFGEAAFTDQSVAYCESLGVEVVDEPELFPVAGGDISGQIQNLVDAGANVLYTNTLAFGPALVAATVNNMGLSDQVQLAGVNWALDTSVGLLGLQSIAPNGLPAVNGMIGSLPFTWWTETDNAGIQVMTEVFQANERPLEIQNIAYLTGFLTIDIFVEAATQTANQIGSGDITGADLKETFENMDYVSMDILEFNFQEGAIRDAELNRMAVLTYAGAEGGTVLDGEPPLLIDTPNGQIPVPVVVALEEFRNTPDLRPGGADVVEE